MGDWAAGAGLLAAVRDGYEMTKLEELARRIENPRLSRIGIEQELETALKSLLDAGEAVLAEPNQSRAERLREQLSQWRSKP